MKASTSRWLALSGAALLAAVLFLLATLPSNDYLFVPNGAHAIAGKVAVQGEDAPEGSGGIYYVDVTVRKVQVDRAAAALHPAGRSVARAAAGGDGAGRVLLRARRRGARRDAAIRADRRRRRARGGRPRRRDDAPWRARGGGRGRRPRGEGALERRPHRRRRRPQGDDGRAAAPRHAGSPTGRRSCGSACGETTRSSSAPSRRSPRRTTRSGRSSASASRRTPRSSCR